jgi:2-iminoacetate synthase ThiH
MPTYSGIDAGFYRVEKGLLVCIGDDWGVELHRVRSTVNMSTGRNDPRAPRAVRIEAMIDRALRRPLVRRSVYERLRRVAQTVY